MACSPQAAQTPEGQTWLEVNRGLQSYRMWSFCCKFMPNVQRVLGSIQWHRQHLKYIWFSTLPLRQKALSLIKHLVFICVRPTFAVVTEKRFVSKNARVYKHVIHIHACIWESINTWLLFISQNLGQVVKNRSESLIRHFRTT